MIELKHVLTFPQEIIALDEVGRSPLSGPVVIGAVRVLIQDAETLKSLIRWLKRKGVKDSKLLTQDARQKVLSDLNIPLANFREKNEINYKQFTISYLTWDMDHQVIEQENILQASLRGMKEAALNLSQADKSHTTLLIDGQMKLKWESEAPWREIPIIKGDVKSALIGLAAIIAKERRDHFMREMHLLYPNYGFDTNVGYPTPQHRQAIAEHGPCPIHRKTFAKVKEFIVLVGFVLILQKFPTFINLVA
jgi:ribonuclease HII